MHKHRLVQSLAAICALVAMLCQGTLVLAGTTGTLTGVVSAADTNGNVTGPLAGATVSAVSASQTASTTTDGTGHFAFVALAPDTYTLAVAKPGYDAAPLAGVNVFADQEQSVNITAHVPYKVITRVNARAASGLVRPGTTVDVYSISAAQQEKTALGGGGGQLNTAWSALTTVPGVFVAPGQAGYVGAASTLSIRGGEYDQIGFEIDGVPVNRSFDNYPSGSASSLGQQELQVYTGVPPANAQANGLSGFINQVIRTGTSPGFVQTDLGLGGPSYYHKFSFEAGGATPNRNFSYYVGLGGYNQDFRFADNFNGASLSNLFGTALAPCSGAPASAEASCYGPGGTSYAFDPLHPNPADPHYNDTNAFFLGPYNAFSGGSFVANPASAAERDSVVNLHFGIPHKNGTRDDFQLLGVINRIDNTFYSSTNDQGGAALLGQTALGVPSFVDGLAYNGPTGTALPSNYQSLIGNDLFPNVGSHTPGQAIPFEERDAFSNDQAIYKLQYSHPMGSNAVAKVYGYTYYSDWLNTGPQATDAFYFGPASPDYELESHTRGLSGSLIDQIDPHNLVNLTLSYTTATSLRANNSSFTVGPGSSMAVLVDSHNPTNGVCYDATGTPQPCYGTNAVTGTPYAQFATFGQAQTGTIPNPSGATCGTGACEYYVIDNGQHATFNTVQPKFASGSLTDDWHPTTKLTVNAGIRYDNFTFDDADTTGTAARTLFYNAYNTDYCATSTNKYVLKTSLGIASNAVATTPCPSGYSAVNVVNPTGPQAQSYTDFQPRVGMTYTLDPRTVVRASYGRYAQAPNAAFEQYNLLQPNAPAALYNTYDFEQFGFTTPDHDIRPEISNNYDFSLEHEFGADTAVKITPFLRKTQDELELFFLNQQTGFSSGLNVGAQTSEGFEFELDKGNFARQGLSARLTFAYTNNSIKYTDLPNGNTVVAPINNDIAAYNAYTKACAAGGHLAGTSSCGATQSGAGASPCYTPAGAADPSCQAGSIANPYWNAPAQSLIDPNSNFAVFNVVPGAIGSQVNAIGAPYTADLVLNERVGKFSFSPIVQFFGGQRYGAPETTLGIAPDTCAGGTGAGVGADGRYPYGAPGGQGYDAATCGQLAAIPNPGTGAFDGIGAFVQPNQLQLHAQMTYEASKNVTFVANMSNLYSSCFGGSKVPWSVPGTCAYTILANGGTGDIGNVYNPGAHLQPYVNRPYLPSFGSTFPFNMYVNAKIKI